MGGPGASRQEPPRLPAASKPPDPQAGRGRGDDLADPLLVEGPGLPGIADDVDRMEAEAFGPAFGHAGPDLAVMAKRSVKNPPALQKGMGVQPDQQMGPRRPLAAGVIMAAFQDPAIPGMNVAGRCIHPPDYREMLRTFLMFSICTAMASSTSA